ncbi:MAG: ABC transporter permease [Alphaproteobacteria bacterium]|nr:ABC transporter permease [Alphaproteobacteria bacterium]
MVKLTNPLALIGRTFLHFLAMAGQFAIFMGKAVGHVFRPPFYFGQIGQQCLTIGYYSLPVIAMTALFAGMVLALQSYTGFSRFNAESAIANVVALSITRELGPVLAGLMVAGRIGASIAAELGTMRVTEQIDALTTLSTNPMKYLVVPRLLAGTLTMPLLVLVADVIGIMGGYVVSTVSFGFNAANYLHQTWDFLEPIDIISGLVKAAVFGFIVTLMGCYCGYHSKGGAAGVGNATTSAVVLSSIVILIANYILTGMFFSK